MGRPGSVSSGDESFVFKYCLSAAAATVAETGMRSSSKMCITYRYAFSQRLQLSAAD